MSMDWVTFGRVLIDTGDLDPVYVMLNEANLPTRTLQRFVVAYTWFYHVGVAAWLAELPLFDAWQEEFDLLPRGTERRHFRGKKARECLNWFLYTYGWTTYHDILQTWFAEPGFRPTLKRIQITPQYGPWIAFKVYDMGVNVLHLPLPQPTPDDLQMYSEPVNGALLIASQMNASMVAPPLTVVPTIVRMVMKTLNVGPLEAETVLCKYKSHVGGHYPVGKDTREIRHALEWRPTPLTEHLLKASIFQ